MKKVPQISQAEWQVMRVIWRQPGQSAQDIIKELVPLESWSGATIKTLLNRLIKKKALIFKKVGKAYFYWPAVAEDACTEKETESFLARYFGGSLTPMLAHFVKTKKLTKAEVEELERLLQKGTSHD